MSQQLLDHNISFLEETQMNIFNEESLNENIFHFVANSLSDFATEPLFLYKSKPLPLSIMLKLTGE